MELGHPRRSLQPGAAAPTGADAHLHRVGADVAQEGGGLGGAGVAAHHRHVGEAVAQLLHGPLHHLGVAVGDVDDQHIGSGSDQGLGPVQEVAPSPDGGPDPQPALGVLADVGPAAVQDDVLFGDEAADPAPVVHQGQLLDAVLVEDPLGLVEGHVGGAGLEPLDRGHGLGHGPLGVVGEPGDVAGRQEPHQHPAAGGVLDEHAGVVLADDLPGLPQGGAAGHGEGLLHHVAVAALDPTHLVGLGLNGHAPVDEPDAALQGHRLGHGPAGDAVHVGRADGQLQVDVGGQRRGQAHVAPRLGDALAGPHQEVVEGLAHEAGLDGSGHWVQGLEVAERRPLDGTGFVPAGAAWPSWPHRRAGRNHERREAMRLAGKVALITGTASGIGRAAALRFASEGARVAAVDVAEANAETAEMVIQRGGEAMAVRADVTVEAEVAAAFEAAESAFGRLDVAFNNAGVMLAGDGDAASTAEEVVDRTLAVNVKGVLHGCKHAVAAMRRSGGGSIINTASFVASVGAATPQIAYTASKGAVLSLTRELAVLHAREGIRVNALSPGPLRTELLMRLLDTEEKRQRRLVHVPMGRFGEADELAAAALFLASDDSSYMTGANLQVDGGLTAAYVTPE